MSHSPPSVPLHDPSNPVRLHWSRDFVEHLRTVHFALVATCLALILLATSTNLSEVQTAYEQLRYIHELLQSIRSSSTSWVDEQVSVQVQAEENERHSRLRFRSLTATPQKVILKCPKGNYGQGLLAVLVEPHYVLDVPRLDSGKPSLYTDQELSEVFAPKSLADFRHLWDVLNNKDVWIRLPREFGYDIFLGPPSDVQSCQSHTTAVPVQLPPTSVVLPLSFRRASADDDISKKAIKILNDFDKKMGEKTQFEAEPVYYYGGPAKEFRLNEIPAQFGTEKGKELMNLLGEDWVALDVETDVLPFDGQAGLIRKMGSLEKSSDWREGDFQHSFPQLDNITKDYQALEIENIQRVLDAERRRTHDSFEAFGLKIPAAAASQYGILLVLGLQLYFWLHLYELGTKLAIDDPGWDVAWIGMYRSSYSKAVMAFTVVVIPVCAAVALGARGLFATSFGVMAWMIAAAGALTTATMGLLTFFHLPQPGQKRAAEHRATENDNTSQD